MKTITLDDASAELLTASLDTMVKIARRDRWVLGAVQPLINLMHEVDRQTNPEHPDYKRRQRELNPCSES
jgi:hypothetical protein